MFLERIEIQESSVRIEHAIYTSSCNERNEGYQVVAASSGICAEERNELVAWCPSHDGLLTEAVALGGLSSFQLSNGQRWVTRTETAGEEYSGRGGARLVTHCLRVPLDVLRKFANNPFAVLDAAIAGGRLDIEADAVGVLEPFTLVGRAKAFDVCLLRDCEQTLGRDGLLDLLGVCCSAGRIAFVGGDTSRWMAATLNLLPITVRRDLSLSTGLRHVASRQFQWFQTPNDVRLHRQWQRDGILVFCHGAGCDREAQTQTDPSGDATGTNAWVSFVANCIDHDTLSELQIAIENDNAPSDLMSLDQYGRTQNMSLPEQTPPPSHTNHESDLNTYAIHVDADDLVARLEVLDDAIFDAINGDESSLVQAKTYWQEVTHAVGEELVDESREQYLRYATDVWKTSREENRVGPEQAAAALDVIAMLTR